MADLLPERFHFKSCNKEGPAVPILITHQDQLDFLDPHLVLLDLLNPSDQLVNPSDPSALRGNPLDHQGNHLDLQEDLLDLQVLPGRPVDF